MTYRAPLAEGTRRYRVHRATVSLSPSTFDKVRALADQLDQAFSTTASQLLEQALAAGACAKGGGTT